MTNFALAAAEDSGEIAELSPLAVVRRSFSVSHLVRAANRSRSAAPAPGGETSASTSFPHSEPYHNARRSTR